VKFDQDILDRINALDTSKRDICLAAKVKYETFASVAHRLKVYGHASIDGHTLERLTEAVERLERKKG